MQGDRYSVRVPPDGGEAPRRATDEAAMAEILGAVDFDGLLGESLVGISDSPPPPRARRQAWRGRY